MQPSRVMIDRASIISVCPPEAPCQIAKAFPMAQKDRFLPKVTLSCYTGIYLNIVPALVKHTE